MKRNLFTIAEGWLRVENILYAFWGFFWMLNGLDKFFDGTRETQMIGGKAFSVGWFGVDREVKMKAYFKLLHLPEWLATSSLFGFAVIEIILGLTFFAVILFRGIPKVVHRMAFKASMIVFVIFSIGDILFGDRMELWEHGTFLILTVITFRLYIDRGVVRAEVVGGRVAVVDKDQDGAVSTLEFDQFLIEQRLKERGFSDDDFVDPRNKPEE